jgi:diguanylate cyclase (GGDEF)-like protein
MTKETLLTSTDDVHVVRFFEKFSDATRLYICSYDDSSRIINDFTGSDKEREIIKKYATDEMMEEMYSRLTLDSIEDQIIEDTSCPYIKLGAIVLKFEGHCREVWFFVGFVTDDLAESLPEELSVLTKRLTYREFVSGIDALRDIGDYRISAELSLAQYAEKSRKSLFSVNEMAASLKRVESLTEILKYLDSDNAVESIMSEFLRITSQYLGVSQADIFKIKERKSRDVMDVVATYLSDGMVSMYEKTTEIPRFEFLEGKKSIILSSGATALKEIDAEVKGGKVKALIAMPVTIGQTTNMYAVFLENSKERDWQIHELQFLSDAVRVLQNILEKRVQKNSLISSYASLEQMLEHVGCAIIVNDVARHETLFVNKIMQSLFPKGTMSEELEGIIWGNNQEVSGIKEYYDYAQDAWYEIHHSDIHWVDGRPVSLYAIYDVTEKKVYQRKIEQQAYTDFLTGLFNRMCCERDLARIIDESKKSNRSGALLYMDLDDFKHINDGLGHQYGDVLLKDISHGISSVKGLEENCYRMGGDEFVMIIHPRVFDELDRIISDIRDVFLSPFILKDGEYYCTMSMGIVVFPEEGEEVGELIQKADVAMYEAKKTGKNRVAKYVTGSTSDANKRLDMEKNMRDATADSLDEFLVYYQPIIDIQKEGNPCVGAEALVRWDSRVMGFISPGEFIPLAEYLGLINPIGEHVLKEACRTLKFWNDNGHPEYKVNVNLSVVQLMQNDIVESIEAVVKETGINPHNLTLEVTESLAINDMGRMKNIMNGIRQLGIRIALDDFGTGYSSLNHIREIPLDVIKVDQSFVKELAQDDYSQSFIRMVAELASAIDVDICVEGIESEKQYKVLENMKVRLIQGYYFGRPMTHDEFIMKYL